MKKFLQKIGLVKPAPVQEIGDEWEHELENRGFNVYRKQFYDSVAVIERENEEGTQVRISAHRSYDSFYLEVTIQGTPPGWESKTNLRFPAPIEVRKPFSTFPKSVADLLKQVDRCLVFYGFTQEAA